MFFESRKDWFFKLLIIVFILLFLSAFTLQLYLGGWEYKLEFLITDVSLFAILLCLL